MIARSKTRLVRGYSLHIGRVAVFLGVIVLIRIQHAKFANSVDPVAMPSIETIQDIFPDAISIDGGSGGWFTIQSVDGDELGECVLTSPASDHIIGFSGSTNCIIGLRHNKIVGVAVLSSGDTQEHVDQVRKDVDFWGQFTEKSVIELATMELDAVSGATLTSLSIAESIVNRLEGPSLSLKFGHQLPIEVVQRIFPKATSLRQERVTTSMFSVHNTTDKLIGQVLRTSPAGDKVVGYQGPTDCLIGLNQEGNVEKLAIHSSFDNEPYVGYVHEDRYFKTLLAGYTIQELASLDLDHSQFDGVSGATMTSQSIIESIKLSASAHLNHTDTKALATWNLKWRDYSTIAIVIAALTIGLTRLRGKRILRLIFQLLLIGYLGLVNGDLLSQALVVGWAETNVPWRSATGIVFLSVAAFAIPILSKRNLYCTHICPHGAVQEIVGARSPWKLRIERRTRRWLKFLPAVLLFHCFIVGLLNLPVSLVGIEPFNAWVFRIAGWSTIAVATIGLTASIFVPMAYCKFGCPTGALLNFLRYNSNSNRWNRADSFAIAMLLLASGLTYLH